MPAPEFVYPAVFGAVHTAFFAFDVQTRVTGAEHVPRVGGAVLACNHVSYLDFIFSGYGVIPVDRLVRFMAKTEVFDHPVSGPMMRNMRHISVDRSAGAASFDLALDALRRGEVIGVFPEATISMSFTLKDFKSGAARLAAQAGVPLVPQVIWGSQRLWTKGHKRNWRRHTPVLIASGEPLQPTPEDDPAVVTKELKSRMGVLLDSVQRDYPEQPAGPTDSWWLPVHLGGTAPTPEEAARLEIETRAAQAAARAARTGGRRRR